MEICHSDEGVIYHYTHLKNKNNKLLLAGTGSSKDKAELPAVILKNKIPLVLVMNGRGVIVKKQEQANESATLDELIQQHLPALNGQEFYVQLYRQHNGSAFIAMCRKEQLNVQLERLNQAKYETAAVFIGASAIAGLQPLWHHLNYVPTSLHTAELSNNYLDMLSPDISKREVIQLDDLAILPEHTLGVAAGLSYLLRTDSCESNNEELIALQTTHYEKNKLKVLMAVTVIIAFVIAIVNVMFYTTYFDKNNRLESELAVYQGKYEQINELLSDYQKNKSLIENAGVLNKNRLSEYGDRIAKTLPDEIVLSELYFNPKNESDESADSLVTFQNDHLVLKGNCSKSFIVNEWINVLKMQKFIKEVSLDKFRYSGEEQRMSMGPNFEISVVTE